MSPHEFDDPEAFTHDERVKISQKAATIIQNTRQQLLTEGRALRKMGYLASELSLVTVHSVLDATEVIDVQWQPRSMRTL